jgi:hypothetical protein
VHFLCRHYFWQAQVLNLCIWWAYLPGNVYGAQATQSLALCKTLFNPIDAFSSIIISYGLNTLLSHVFIFLSHPINPISLVGSLVKKTINPTSLIRLTSSIYLTNLSDGSASGDIKNFFSRTGVTRAWWWRDDFSRVIEERKPKIYCLTNYKIESIK